MIDYKTAIELAIEKEKEVLGEKTAVQVAQGVAELEINEEGGVKRINDGGKNALDKLVESYQDVGGSVSASLIAKRLGDEDLEGLELPDSLKKRLNSR